MVLEGVMLTAISLEVVDRCGPAWSTGSDSGFSAGAIIAFLPVGSAVQAYEVSYWSAVSNVLL